MKKRCKAGFTLVEVMVAATISVAVFFAMGTVLVRGFSLWRDGASRWYLAQRARVARVRLLNYGYNAGSGMLASSNIVMGTDNNFITIDYTPQGGTETLRLYGGHTGTGKRRPYFYRPTNPKKYWFIELARKTTDTRPEVKTRYFTANIDTTNEVLTISYDLYYDNGGKTYVQPQTITAYLINLNQ